MKFTKRAWTMLTGCLTTLMTFSLFGCGSSNGAVDIFSIGALEGQVMDKDDDGLPMFEEEVELTMWSKYNLTVPPL